MLIKRVTADTEDRYEVYYLNNSWHVCGPDNSEELNYKSANVLKFSSEENAVNAARVANIAYEAGFNRFKNELKDLLE